MKQLRKMVFSIGVVSCFVSGMISSFLVSAEEYTEKIVGDFTVHEYSTYVEIAKYNNKEATNAVIPDEIDGLPVISISSGGYRFDAKTPFGSSQLESITLPKTLINIGKFAFSDSSLKSIEIPDSVKTIGSSAFLNCTKLTSVKLSNQIQTISDQMFNGCTALENCTFPQSLTKIQHHAFQKTALSTILFPDSLREIEYGAFYQCDKLQTVSFPDEMQGVSTLYSNLDGAFEKCTALKEVHISKSMTVNGNAFKGCTALEKIIIDENAKQRNACFDGCKSLKSIAIPASFETCPSFNDCTALTSVHLADGITTTGSFQNCIKLEEITLPESVSKFGDLGLTASFQNCAKLERITIQNSKCKIYDSGSSVCNYTLNGTPYFNGTIYGTDGSTAQSYAQKYGYNFAVIGSEPDVLRGDVTGDGEVSVDDAQLTLKAYTERIAGNDMKLTAEQIKAADVNSDGEVSVDDAQNILKYYTEKSVAGKDITWDDVLGNTIPTSSRPKAFTVNSSSPVYHRKAS